MTEQPIDLELIAQTWTKMMGDPANITSLLFGEMDDFLTQVMNLCVAENFMRDFSIALSLDISRFVKEPSTEGLIDVAEKLLRVSTVRKKLDEIAGTDGD